MSETERLDAIASDSWYAKGANAAMIRYVSKLFSRFWKPGPCLELGPAEGLMTEGLARAFKDLTLVEGSPRFCRTLRKRFPQAEVVNALFENFRPERKFKTIILGHVLEHVESPVKILKLVRGWLMEGGVVCAAVPNARSLHRQAATIMGLLPHEHALNKTDKHQGHRRVYDPESFRKEFALSGLKIRVFGGYWIKPLSNAQIDKTWSSEMLEAFMCLGERYPDIAAEIYVIAHR
jgi:2-polyprenyl-3-methyl-5-hydroxy-6-metoxy-1,4-benzoquinol methylase